MNKILALIDKEWADVFRNRMVALSVTLLPVFMVALPLIILFVMGSGVIPTTPEDLRELPPAVLERPPFDRLEPTAALQAYIGQQFNILFLIIPLAVPMTIAAYSIVGEKREGSLEPLLATPISTAHLLAAKSVAAAAPGILETWLGYVVYVIGVYLAVSDPDARSVLLAPQWVFAVIVLAPLLTVLATTLGLIISSRVNDPRMAEQLGMIAVIPLMALLIAQLAGVLYVDTTVIGIIAILLLIIDYGLLLLAVRLFQRETILTRWK